MKKFIFLLFVFVSICIAQAFGSDDPRAIIEKVKVYRLTQELDLTSTQAVEFFPKLNELQKIEQEFGEEKMLIISELKRLVKQNASDEKIIEVGEKFEKAQKDYVEKQIKKVKEIWAILTPKQMARFLVFREEFNREIRDMIRQIRKHKKP